MDASQVGRNAFTNSAPRIGQYEFVNWECMVSTYRTGRRALEAIVPSPLENVDDIVRYEVEDGSKMSIARCVFVNWSALILKT
jgi:acetoacetate decarboxylase